MVAKFHFAEIDPNTIDVKLLTSSFHQTSQDHVLLLNPQSGNDSLIL